LRVNFQFLQKTRFKSPRSGADYLYTNIETMCSDKTPWMCKQILQKN